LAEGQRQGRGRLGQEWFSPSGVNLYASALFRERLTPREAALFSFIAGLAVADAVKELGLYPAIKWPNDVLVDTTTMRPEAPGRARPTRETLKGESPCESESS